MQTIYFLRGLPGSGKSTFAKKLLKESKDVRRVNKDSIRTMLFGFNKWTHNKEQLVRDIELNTARCIMDSGFDLIVDNTHFDQRHEENYRKLAEEFDALFQLVDFSNVPVETCIRRDHLRNDRVGYKVILGMAEKYIPELYKDFIDQNPDMEKFVNSLQELKFKNSINIELRPCIWVDVDGTLALTCDRDVYDDKKCINDIPNLPIVSLVKIFDKLNYKIFIFSGRSETARDATELWLSKHNIPYDILALRKNNDHREDYIVKREMYEEWIKDEYTCEYVIDDRDQVIRMARQELNLCVLQCNYGNF